MAQIIKNYIFLFAVPFLIGIVVRVISHRTERAYLITSAFIVLAIIGWAVYFMVPSHGSELYGIIALIITCSMAGVLITGLTMRTKRKK